MPSPQNDVGRLVTIHLLLAPRAAARRVERKCFPPTTTTTETGKPNHDNERRTSRLQPHEVIMGWIVGETTTTTGGCHDDSRQMDDDGTLTRGSMGQYSLGEREWRERE